MLFLEKMNIKNLNKNYKVGVTQSKDAYYGQHEPEKLPNSHDLLQKWDAWVGMHTVASEMEGAALFIVSGVRRLKSAAILLLCRNIEREKKYGLTDTEWDTAHAIETAVEAIRSMILKEKAKQ